MKTRGGSKTYKYIGISGKNSGMAMKRSIIKNMKIAILDLILKTSTKSN